MTSSGLTWSEFFKLRRRLQIVQRVGGIPFALGFLTAESTILALPIFDPTKTVWGMDPLVAVGCATLGGSILSYMAGVTISGMIWKCLRPALARHLDEKQRSFYSRITKYRANVPPNPTQLNFTFDYYGEKVRSIADYRHWLRRQYQMKRDRILKVE